MSRPLSVSGTRYVPRRMAGGSPEMPLSRLKNRARAALRSRRLLTSQEKALVRAALASMDEIGAVLGEATRSGPSPESGQLEQRRTEVASLLSLMLDQAEEKRPA